MPQTACAMLTCPSLSLPAATPASRNHNLAVEHNRTVPGLLRLSAELITTIVIEHLSPREAIFLSLTCRDFHRGVLSNTNYYLWYRVGDFANCTPGWSASWALGTLLRDLQANKVQLENNGRANCCDKRKVKVKKLSRNEVWRVFGTYDAEVARVVDFKRLLLETMLRVTDTGCQWCLKMEHARQVYEKWNLRLCDRCFKHNAVRALEVRKLGIETSHLPREVQWKRGMIRYLLFKPSVERLIASSHGPHATLQKLLDQAGFAQLQTYRQEVIEAVFTEFKAHWGTLPFRGDQNTRGDKIAGVRRFVPPEKLTIAWICGPRKIDDCDQSSWLTILFYQDPLLRELRTIRKAHRFRDKMRPLWEDNNWVDKVIRHRLDRLRDALSSPHAITLQGLQDNFIVRHQRAEILKLGYNWHMSRARVGGADELFRRARQEFSLGLGCPFGTCESGPLTPVEQTPPVVRVHRFLTLHECVLHMMKYHWHTFLCGEFEWLVGTPSRWWPINRVQWWHPGASSMEYDACGEWFRRELMQERWLSKWWNNKWTEDHSRVLRGWAAKREFFNVD
ncbi:hypothetical protein BDZ91DRAFT_737414 [Kalaharituber pfeilii]|nr:hypothetical protein BDZ91DRAFT_737414 [Kalaharituber pfeilii]